jgi:hypothetical protein
MVAHFPGYLVIVPGKRIIMPGKMRRLDAAGYLIIKWSRFR